MKKIEEKKFSFSYSHTSLLAKCPIRFSHIMEIRKPIGHLVSEDDSSIVFHFEIVGKFFLYLPGYLEK